MSVKFTYKTLVESLSCNSANMVVARNMYEAGIREDHRILGALVDIRQYLMPSVYEGPMTDAEIMARPDVMDVKRKEKFLTDYVLSYFMELP